MIVPPSTRILVTGASRGIGRAIAQSLAGPDRDLVLVARSSRSLDEVADECVERGAQVCTVACDLARVESVQRMVDIVVADSPPTMVVNAAGVKGEEVSPWEADPHTWWYTQCVNVRGPYLIAQRLVPEMLRVGGGRILDLSSGAAVTDRADSSDYWVSKTALFRLGSSLHEAGYHRGLRVLELAPGVVLTDMTRDMAMHRGRTQWTAMEDVTAIACAFADGDLDGLSGTQVRAGTDSLDELRTRSQRGIGDDERKLRLTPWSSPR